MGDPARFREFAKIIANNFPKTNSYIADVAGGKGYLQAALRCHKYENIITFDKRPKMAKHHRQKYYRYEWFSYNKHRKEFDLVVAMHPDAGTDHSILYAVNNKVPFVICPCCIIPSASTYWDGKNFNLWIEHLIKLCQNTHTVEKILMPISGKNLVLLGKINCTKE